MSFEERANSWALSLVDALESDPNHKVRVFGAAGGLLLTIGMWVVHLAYPNIFRFFIEVDDWAKLFLGFVLAPPFLVAFSIGSLIYSEPREPNKADESGPMSTYFYQESAMKKWKVLVVAGIVTGLNFVLMLVVSVG